MLGRDQTAMDRWVATFANRDDMAPAYHDLFTEHGPDWGVWPILNAAIIDRWSVGGLLYIKDKAWAT